MLLQLSLVSAALDGDRDNLVTVIDCSQKPSRMEEEKTPFQTSKDDDKPKEGRWLRFSFCALASVFCVLTPSCRWKGK